MVFLILVFLLLAASGSVSASFEPNTSWQGDVSSNWSEAGNWDNGVPTSSSQAAIDDTGGYSVVIGSWCQCGRKCDTDRLGERRGEPHDD